MRASCSRPATTPSMRHAAGPRVELGTRTIFNLLGPLSNPARVQRQLIGVFSPDWTRPMAETLAALGSERAWIVHGQGLDELTVAGENQVTALAGRRDRRLHRRPRRTPAWPRADRRRSQGGDAAFNAAALLALLRGATGRLSRHRAAERRRRSDRRRPGRRSCATASTMAAARRSHRARRWPRWKPCDAIEAA